MNQLPSAVRTYSFEDILHATRDLSASAVIGEGGFGRVYRSMVGMAPVAIKVLDVDSLQGIREFENEVRLHSELAHPHLVTLRGFCSDPPCLVYDLMPLGTLEEAIRGREALSFAARVGIATQVSYALSYLHARGLIHRDIKSSNIFLDADHPPNARIGDLGLAQSLFSSDPPSESSVLVGDWQWLAPELRATGKATLKSDVFSFGLVLIQLLSGSLKPKEVVPKLIQAHEEGSSMQILDPRMMAKGGVDGLLAERMVKLALWMCSMEPEHRPDMSVIFTALQTIMIRIEA